MRRSVPLSLLMAVLVGGTSCGKSPHEQELSVNAITEVAERADQLVSAESSALKRDEEEAEAVADIVSLLYLVAPAVVDQVRNKDPLFAAAPPPPSAPVRPDAPDADVSEPQPAKPKRPNRQELRSDIATLLQRRADDISNRHVLASSHANWTQLIETEAELNVLHRNLAESLSPAERRSLLPTDPLALASEKSLGVALEHTKSTRRYFQSFSELLELPEVAHTISNLEQRERRLESLLASGEPSKFHRARDDLADALDFDKWKVAQQNYKKAVKAEAARVLAIWTDRMPVLQAFLRAPPPIRGPPPHDPPSLHSKKVLKSIQSYLNAPRDWAVLEAQLRTDYNKWLDRTPNPSINGRPRPSFYQWSASLLNDVQLASAADYTARVVASEPMPRMSAMYEPFVPSATEMRHIKELDALLREELRARKEHRAQPLSEQAIRYGSEHPIRSRLTDRVHLLHVATARYGRPSHMPKSVARVIDKVVNEDLDKELANLTQKTREMSAYDERTQRVSKRCGKLAPISADMRSLRAKARAVRMQRRKARRALRGALRQVLVKVRTAEVSGIALSENVLSQRDTLLSKGDISLATYKQYSTSRRRAFEYRLTDPRVTQGIGAIDEATLTYTQRLTDLENKVGFVLAEPRRIALHIASSSKLQRRLRISVNSASSVERLTFKLLKLKRTDSTTYGKLTQLVAFDQNLRNSRDDLSQFALNAEPSSGRGLRLSTRRIHRAHRRTKIELDIKRARHKQHTTVPRYIHTPPPPAPPSYRKSVWSRTGASGANGAIGAPSMGRRGGSRGGGGFGLHGQLRRNRRKKHLES